MAPWGGEDAHDDFFHFFSLDLLTADPDVWYHSASFGEELACQHDFRQVT